jgi:hypothetical protein
MQQYNNQEAERGPCVICGARPTIYKIRSQGFCIKHREEALQATRKVSIAISKEKDADSGALTERQKREDLKARFPYKFPSRGFR